MQRSTFGRPSYSKLKRSQSPQPGCAVHLVSCSEEMLLFKFSKNARHISNMRLNWTIYPNHDVVKLLSIELLVLDGGCLRGDRPVEKLCEYSCSICVSAYDAFWLIHMSHYLGEHLDAVGELPQKLRETMASIGALDERIQSISELIDEDVGEVARTRDRYFTQFNNKDDGSSPPPSKSKVQ